MGVSIFSDRTQRTQVSRERDEGLERGNELEGKVRELSWSLQQQTEAMSRLAADGAASQQRATSEVGKLKRDLERAVGELDENGRLNSQLQAEVRARERHIVC